MAEINFEKKWEEFFRKEKYKAYQKIDEFLTEFEKDYKNKKIKEFENSGTRHLEAVIKARQSWVAYVGHKLEIIIRKIVEPIVKKHGAKIIRDKDINRNKINKEFDLVRRELLVHFGKYSFLPDADLIIYKFDKNKEKANIISILSMKNSFRERYTETPYWKLKLNESKITKNIEVYIVTPDRDNEIISSSKPSKARVILENELDGVFIAKSKDEFGHTNKVGDIEDLLKKLEKLLK